ncbi:MAG: aspartate carbamoyltransferase [Eubacteriales bacterium]|nr:aspartate carbamoyltransferase [Eubacteriales bacterium]
MSEIRNLINITDLSLEEIDQLINVADDIVANHKDYENICAHKKLATLFFEPSTRTRLSFESAMLELGGSVLGFSSANSSSAAKGESVSDTIRTVGCYVDIIAMRHPKEGAPIVGTQRTTVPIINAGDGGHFHPTQTLTDLLTIKRKKDRLDNLTVGLCGDLQFGRTVHSLIEAMLRYENVKFVLISPEELRVPEYVKEKMNTAGAEWCEVENLEEAMPELDILYMTRVQKERFFNEEDYVRLKDSYILDLNKLKTAKKDLSILHPLPRVNEISVEVDDDPRACYFFQALCGKHIRMALILFLLGIKKEEK